MKKEIFIAATLFATAAHAQLSGPNRPGPGTSPGTLQTPATPPADLPPPVPSDPLDSSPRPGSLLTTPPRTTSGEPFRSTTSPTIRREGSINDSRDWERSVGGPASSGRLTPSPDIAPPVRPLTGGSTNAPGARLGTDLNTSGINTPARVPEQPLDRALSAKIRAQLSMTPAGTSNQPTVRVAPETVRDLRITSQNGKVILEGNVPSETEKRMIELRAKQVQGVAAVENRLLVRPRSVGAPGSIQSGQSQPRPIDRSTGQSPQNSSELRDEHRELTPDP